MPLDKRSQLNVMSRTGGRAAELGRILQAAGLHQTAPLARRPGVSDLNEPLTELYRAIDGSIEDPPLRPGGWDLSFEEGFVVELDEELHFNRYRLQTLDAAWATDLPWQEEYRRFCVEREDACLRAGAWGRRWTNPSSARMFTGGDPGDLRVGAGGPRWKQRALYDAMKDAAPSLGIVALSRVSIHDIVDGVELEQVLRGRAAVRPGAVRRLVESRLVPASK